ncbi:MAG: cytochrome c family protein [Bacteroidales bacterium]|nr:cytochrome c family protein [Bacteroidales bacterium]
MIAKILPLLFILGLFAAKTPAPPATYKYVGAAKCKMCHNKPPKGEQYKKWSQGPHAKAMKSLSADEAKDPKCLKCHSTAAGVDAGLKMGITVKEGVSCESCHGPGSMYKSMTIMKNKEKALASGLILPDEKVCIKCHNKESKNFKSFNYKEYVAKIAHPDPTRK